MSKPGVEKKDGGFIIRPTQQNPNGKPPQTSIEAFRQADQEALRRQIQHSNPSPQRGKDFPDHGQDPALGG